MLRWLFCFVALCISTLAWAGSIDINSATAAQLDTLPGIGPAKAQAILDFRSQNGPFQKIEDIIMVPGIGPATYANIKAQITVGGGNAAPADEGGGEAPATEGEEPTPEPAPASSGPPVNAININTATEAELETLPGIGPTKAAAIVADRQTNGPFASCQDLSRVTGIGPATVSNVAPTCTVE